MGRGRAYEDDFEEAVDGAEEEDVWGDYDREYDEDGKWDEVLSLLAFTSTTVQILTQLGALHQEKDDGATAAQVLSLLALMVQKYKY
jgi:hypothetical protein